ncbi:hypothetical protein BDZ97DRAFT_709055 [Flammula alnicola]|nr:hypothetical protein BDZ97DRAFT_709055 [Flammula alnicola]
MYIPYPNYVELNTRCARLEALPIRTASVCELGMREPGVEDSFMRDVAELRTLSIHGHWQFRHVTTPYLRLVHLRAISTFNLLKLLEPFSSLGVCHLDDIDDGSESVLRTLRPEDVAHIDLKLERLTSLSILRSSRKILEHISSAPTPQELQFVQYPGELDIYSSYAIADVHFSNAYT